jgi:hypothetical protein
MIQACKNSPCRVSIGRRDAFAAPRWLIAFCLVVAITSLAIAQQPADAPAIIAPPKSDSSLANREAELAKMLSGATLEGSFTVTGRDLTKLSPEKYTLGEVKKVEGNLWVFPTRIEYGDKDLTLPITLPIEWAADTPLVVVDNLGLPGLGTVSARVMFFADHYAGYWKHGDAGGHLFGVIRRKNDEANSPE